MIKTLALEYILNYYLLDLHFQILSALIWQKVTSKALTLIVMETMLIRSERRKENKNWNSISKEEQSSEEAQDNPPKRPNTILQGGIWLIPKTLYFPKYLVLLKRS